MVIGFRFYFSIPIPIIIDEGKIPPKSVHTLILIEAQVNGYRVSIYTSVDPNRRQ
jgi:hypothetical protein